MRLLFVFVFLLGLVSCGGEDEKKSSSSSSFDSTSAEVIFSLIGNMKQPNCDEIDGITPLEGKPDKYTGIIKRCSNGKITRFQTFKDGVKDGLGMAWHENGQLSAIGQMKNGEKVGITKIWHENGQLKAVGDFTDDKKGEKMLWYDKDGKAIDHE